MFYVSPIVLTSSVTAVYNESDLTLGFFPSPLQSLDFDESNNSDQNYFEMVLGVALNR